MKFQLRSLKEKKDINGKILDFQVRSLVKKIVYKRCKEGTWTWDCYCGSQ